MHLLIPYVHLPHHNDPILEEFTYGDHGARGKKLRHLRKGDYVFFHTTIGGKKCITAYYVVERYWDTAEAARDRNIAAKYKSPHISEFLSGERSYRDDVMIFGDPILSRTLRRPLLFDKALAKRLSLGIRFPSGKSEARAIGEATRAWRHLTDDDVETFLEAIKSSEEELPVEAILSTGEVTEVIEKDIETFIERNPSLLGRSLKLEARQFDTDVGRIDLLFRNKRNYLVVEIKLHRIGRDAVSQLRRYMNWVKKNWQGRVSGAIVCEGVMPAFQEEFRKLKNIRILCYGWQLKVCEWGGTR
jgi:hypothetical protein